MTAAPPNIDKYTTALRGLIECEEKTLRYEYLFHFKSTWQERNRLVRAFLQLCEQIEPMYFPELFFKPMFDSLYSTFHYACRYNWVQIVCFIIEKTRRLAAPIDKLLYTPVGTNAAKTPLWIAATKTTTRVFYILLRNTTTAQEWGPVLQLCIRRKYKKKTQSLVAKILEVTPAAAAAAALGPPVLRDIIHNGWMSIAEMIILKTPHAEKWDAFFESLAAAAPHQTTKQCLQLFAWRRTYDATMISLQATFARRHLRRLRVLPDVHDLVVAFVCAGEKYKCIV
jgi:hypothetical protein